MAQFQKQYPDIKPMPPETRALAISRSMKTKLQNPLFMEKMRLLGLSLAAKCKDMTPEQKAAIQEKSKNTFMERFTPEERSARARAAHSAAVEKYPNLSSMAGTAAIPHLKSPERRKLASDTAKRLWSNPEHRKLVTESSRRMALNGDIPLRMPGIRPTKSERIMIAFIEKHGIPLKYVGDNAVRVNILDGNRHWRNPDFILEGEKKAVLLDGFWNPQEHDEEMMDYKSAGWEILRVSVNETTDEKWLLHKLKKFIGKKSPASKPSPSMDLFSTLP